MVGGSNTRGSDVVKAIALGADAVVVGRLYVYGLAAAGGPGVVRLFEILEDEIRICLSLLGVNGYDELDQSYIRAARPVVPAHVHSPFPHHDLLRAMVLANSSVLARSWSRGTRWLRRPMRWASSASTTRAENNNSLAIGQPTWFGSVQVLLILPYAAARKRNFVSSQPIRMSSEEASTAAPP